MFLGYLFSVFCKIGAATAYQDRRLFRIISRQDRGFPNRKEFSRREVSQGLDVKLFEAFEDLPRKMRTGRQLTNCKLNNVCVQKAATLGAGDTLTGCKCKPFCEQTAQGCFLKRNININWPNGYFLRSQ